MHGRNTRAKVKEDSESLGGVPLFTAGIPAAGAATQQIAPPTRAPAGRGPTDARHSRHARSRSHHGHRAATVTS